MKALSVTGVVLVGVVGVVGAACGKGPDTTAAESKGEPVGRPPAAAPVDAQPAAPTKAAVALPEIPPIEPLQLEAVVASHEFDVLGWTRDGMSFALQQRYLDDLDGNRSNGDEVLYELREVYDALTGALVHSFRVRKSKKGLENYEDGRAAWERAKPKAAWKAFATANPLVAKKPATKVSGGWSLSARKVADSFGPHMELSIEKRKSGFFYRGDFIAAKRDPTFEVIGKRAGASHVLLRHAWPTSKRAEIRGFVRGNVRGYWSPQGDRVVWAVFSNPLPETTASTRQRAHVQLGALGPQIIVIDRGIGLHAARASAVLLGRASLPVARVYPQPTAKGVGALATSRVLYVGEDAKKTAAAAAQALPGKVAIEAAPADHPRAGEAAEIVELGGSVAPDLALTEGRGRLYQLGASIAPDGRDIARLCRWFVETRMSMASGDEVEESALDPAALLSCSKKMRGYDLRQRNEIADCANACGDMDGIPACYEQYGTKDFPACEGEGEP